MPSPRHVRMAVASLAAALPLASKAALAGERPRAEIRIREVVLSDGARRYGVPVTVGATAIEAGLDSGSPGLRILPGALQPSDARTGMRRATVHYGAGAKLDGAVARAVVAVGAVSGEIAVQLVDAVSCEPELPRCAAGRLPLKDYGVQGDGLAGEGFKAILGTNMADSDVPSVFRALGVRRWIVELPRPGEPTSGRLVLNPTEAEVAGYARLRLAARFADRHGGLHDAVEGCIQNTATHQSLCGAVLMDTGAPGVTVEADGTGPLWPSGSPAVLALTGTGGTIASASFYTDRREHASHLTFRAGHGSHGEGGGPTVIYAGLLPYFTWSVLYDPAAGELGIKPRPVLAQGPTPSPVAP